MVDDNIMGFPGGSNGKESACNTGDRGSIPGSGRAAGGGIGNPLQYSCLQNSMDREAWWATVHGVTKSRIRLSNTHTHTHLFISGVYLLYNVVLVSAVQQSKSAVRIHISPLPWISFPFRSTQGMEWSSLGYTVGPYYLSILYIKVSEYISNSYQGVPEH